MSKKQAKIKNITNVEYFNTILLKYASQIVWAKKIHVLSN